MIKDLLKTLFVAFGLAFLLAGQGLAVSKSGSDLDIAAPMDGPFGHAMEHEDDGKAKKDCPGKGCDNCDMTNCPATTCSSAATTETLVAFFESPGVANVSTNLPVLAGLERHNLPLPPP